MRRAAAGGLRLLVVGSAGAAAAPDAAPQLGYWDNWTDAAGVSHLTRCALRHFLLEAVSRQAAPEWRDRQATPARAVVIHVEPPGWVGGWHENPTVQWITPLAGAWFLQATDGSSITAKPGDIVIGEDQGAKPDGAGHAGHLSRNDGPVAVSLLIVQMAGLPSAKRPCRFQ